MAMPSTCTPPRFLSRDILTPEPDWDAIAVYSDYLEDDGRPNRLALATILRWLRTWNHWPNYFDNGHFPFELYTTCLSSKLGYLADLTRYAESENPLSPSSFIRKHLRRAFLPPSFYIPFSILRTDHAPSYICLQQPTVAKLFQELLLLAHVYPSLFLSNPIPYVTTKNNIYPNLKELYPNASDSDLNPNP